MPPVVNAGAGGLNRGFRPTSALLGVHCLDAERGLVLRWSYILALLDGAGGNDLGVLQRIVHKLFRSVVADADDVG